LAAFIYEATTEPFKGPATDDFHRHGIYYSDIHSLMAAYLNFRTLSWTDEQIQWRSTAAEKESGSP
jgi:hypothetical protein